MTIAVHTHRRAFTLMEMLAALTIGMLVVMSAVGATRALTAAREKVDRRTEQTAEARRALETIVAALRNVRRDESEADQPVVIGSREAGNAGDRINLLVIADRRSRPEGPESDQYEVAFFLESAAGGESLPRLMCRRDHALDERIEEGGTVTLVAENIIGLSFAYQAGGEWYDQWPATEMQPPEAVRVSVAVAQPPGPGQAKPEVIALSTVVALHAAPRPAATPQQAPGDPAAKGARP